MTDYRLLLDSDVFDPEHYRRESGMEGSFRRLAEHYLDVGERAGLRPGADFDPAFYAAANPDVARSGGVLLAHYLIFGRNEGRYATRVALHRDGRKLRESHLYRSELFSALARFAPVPGVSDVEAYLLYQHRFPALGALFDATFYREHYPDCVGTGAPIVHYLDIGRAEGRVPTRVALEQRTAAAAPSFDVAHYLAQFAEDARPVEPLRHFVLYGETLGYEPERAFATDYYRRRNPATVDDGASPYMHFVVYGRAEGRAGRLDLGSRRRDGRIPFRPDAPGLVVVTPDMKPGGTAELALLLAERLGATRNIVFVARNGGTLAATFDERGCASFVGNFDELDAEHLLRDVADSYRAEAVLINSAFCWEFGSAAVFAGVPSLALVHEYAEYVEPSGRVTALVEFADRVVFPSRGAAESIERDVVEARGFASRNATIRAQCRVPAIVPARAEHLTPADVRTLLGCTGRDVPLVLGAGPTALRTGIDLFVETAALVRDRLPDARFVWLSADYRPKSDIGVSVWIADMIEKFALGERLFILDRAADFAVFAREAGVFYAPARADGFPWYATEARAEGLPVVCFSDTGGMAETLEREPSLGTVVRYAELSHAADAIVAACSTKRDRETAPPPEDGIDAYVDFIETSLADAARERRALLEGAPAVVGAGDEFDPAFHDGDRASSGGLAARRARLAYAVRTAKGLATLNPVPGFDVGAYLARPTGADATPNGASGTSTHRCVDLDALPQRQTPALRIALHLHLHYPELAAEFFERVRDVAVPMDLFVSTTRKGRAMVEHAFADYDGGTLSVVAVPNVGRDIGPLLIEFARPLVRGAYDLIGHLHGKRSLTAPPGLGERWRSYLVQTLLGERESFAKLVRLFASEPSLGLVFAEDRYTVPWGENRPFAERLATELHPQPTLPAWPIFPKGTMFWCRPEVLQSLWNRGFVAADFPAEPLPDDGSILHAIERMLPALAEASGYDWATILRATPSW